MEHEPRRWVWVEDATTRILNDIDPDEPGATHAEPLGPPPPLDFRWPPLHEEGRG